MARSGSGISAIFASTALSPSALSACGPGRAAAFFAACLVVLLALRIFSVICVRFSLDTSEAAGGSHPRTALSAMTLLRRQATAHYQLPKTGIDRIAV